MKIERKHIVVPDELVKTCSLKAIGYYCKLFVEDIEPNDELLSELSNYVKYTKTDTDIPVEFTNTLYRQVNDNNLREALVSYIRKRLYPEDGSRFKGVEFKPFHLTLLIKQLEAIENKVDTVKFCTENEYFKFFELDPLDTVKSNTYVKK